MKNPILMIKQCIEKDEPYFVLRGQDICALTAIKAYFEAVKEQVAKPSFLEEIEEIMNDFQTYSEEIEKIKTPD